MPFWGFRNLIAWPPCANPGASAAPGALDRAPLRASGGAQNTRNAGSRRARPPPRRDPTTAPCFDQWLRLRTACVGPAVAARVAAASPDHPPAALGALHRVLPRV